MIQDFDPRAYQTEHGVQAQCPTTGERYIALTTRITSSGIWSICACCDALRNTGEQCDPQAPQWHCHQWGTE